MKMEHSKPYFDISHSQSVLESYSQWLNLHVDMQHQQFICRSAEWVNRIRTPRAIFPHCTHTQCWVTQVAHTWSGERHVVMCRTVRRQMYIYMYVCAELEIRVRRTVHLV
jgi:hypothetical protein